MDNVENWILYHELFLFLWKFLFALMAVLFRFFFKLFLFIIGWPFSSNIEKYNIFLIDLDEYYFAIEIFFIQNNILSFFFLVQFFFFLILFIILFKKLFLFIIKIIKRFFNFLFSIKAIIFKIFKIFIKNLKYLLNIYNYWKNIKIFFFVFFIFFKRLFKSLINILNFTEYYRFNKNNLDNTFLITWLQHRNQFKVLWDVLLKLKLSWILKINLLLKKKIKKKEKKQVGKKKEKNMKLDVGDLTDLRNDFENYFENFYFENNLKVLNFINFYKIYLWNYNRIIIDFIIIRFCRIIFFVFWLSIRFTYIYLFKNIYKSLKLLKILNLIIIFKLEIILKIKQYCLNNSLYQLFWYIYILTINFYKIMLFNYHFYPWYKSITFFVYGDINFNNIIFLKEGFKYQNKRILKLFNLIKPFNKNIKFPFLYLFKNKLLINQLFLFINEKGTSYFLYFINYLFYNKKKNNQLLINYLIFIIKYIIYKNIKNNIFIKIIYFLFFSFIISFIIKNIIFYYFFFFFIFSFIIFIIKEKIKNIIKKKYKIIFKFFLKIINYFFWWMGFFFFLIFIDILLKIIKKIIIQIFKFLFNIKIWIFFLYFYMIFFYFNLEMININMYNTFPFYYLDDNYHNNFIENFYDDYIIDNKKKLTFLQENNRYSTFMLEYHKDTELWFYFEKFLDNFFLKQEGFYKNHPEKLIKRSAAWYNAMFKIMPRDLFAYNIQEFSDMIYFFTLFDWELIDFTFPRDSDNLQWFFNYKFFRVYRSFFNDLNHLFWFWFNELYTLFINYYIFDTLNKNSFFLFFLLMLDSSKENLVDINKEFKTEHLLDLKKWLNVEWLDIPKENIKPKFIKLNKVELDINPNNKEINFKDFKNFNKKDFDTYLQKYKYFKQSYWKFTAFITVLDICLIYIKYFFFWILYIKVSGLFIYKIYVYLIYIFFFEFYDILEKFNIFINFDFFFKKYINISIIRKKIEILSIKFNLIIIFNLMEIYYYILIFLIKKSSITEIYQIFYSYFLISLNFLIKILNFIYLDILNNLLTILNLNFIKNNYSKNYHIYILIFNFYNSLLYKFDYLFNYILTDLFELNQFHTFSIRKDFLKYIEGYQNIYDKFLSPLHTVADTTDESFRYLTHNWDYFLSFYHFDNRNELFTPDLLEFIFFSNNQILNWSLIIWPPLKKILLLISTFNYYIIMIIVYLLTKNEDHKNPNNKTIKELWSTFRNQNEEDLLWIKNEDFNKYWKITKKNRLKTFKGNYNIIIKKKIFNTDLKFFFKKEDLEIYFRSFWEKNENENLISFSKLLNLKEMINEYEKTYNSFITLLLSNEKNKKNIKKIILILNNLSKKIKNNLKTLKFKKKDFYNIISFLKNINNKPNNLNKMDKKSFIYNNEYINFIDFMDNKDSKEYKKFLLFLALGYKKNIYIKELFDRLFLIEISKMPLIEGKIINKHLNFLYSFFSYIENKIYFQTNSVGSYELIHKNYTFPSLTQKKNYYLLKEIDRLQPSTAETSHIQISETGLIFWSFFLFLPFFYIFSCIIQKLYIKTTLDIVENFWGELNWLMDLISYIILKHISFDFWIIYIFKNIWFEGFDTFAYLDYDYDLIEEDDWDNIDKEKFKDLLEKKIDYTKIKQKKYRKEIGEIRKEYKEGKIDQIYLADYDEESKISTVFLTPFNNLQNSLDYLINVWFTIDIILWISNFFSFLINFFIIDIFFEPVYDYIFCIIDKLIFFYIFIIYIYTWIYKKILNKKDKIYLYTEMNFSFFHITFLFLEKRFQLWNTFISKYKKKK